MGMPTNDARSKFQFRSPGMQRGEARANVRETLELLERRSPPHLQPEPEGETTEAGQCFRRVTRILAGQRK